MSKLNPEKGLIINQAQEILKKTYKEINKIKLEFEDLMTDYDSTLQYGEEYSYGPKSLMLKANHTFLFKRERTESDIVERIFAIIILLNDDGTTLKRINLKEEPEIWFLLLDVNNRDTSIRPWDAYSILTKEEKEFFTEDELRVDGTIFSYNWKEEDEMGEEKESDSANLNEQWHGRLIGYPLTSIVNREFIKNNVFDKLWQDEESSS